MAGYRNAIYGNAAESDLHYAAACCKPTAKQRCYYSKLYSICKQHEIEPVTNNALGSRGECARAISVMKQRIEAAGINSYTGEILNPSLEVQAI